MGFLKIKDRETPLRSAMQNFAGQGGQILLIVVLAAVVALTVSLSAVSRTITNTRVTTEEANSQKALSAAEAGVEELVSRKGGSASQNLSNNSSFVAGVTPILSPDILVNGGNTVLKDEGADVWLSTYPDFTFPWSGNLTVYYSDNDGCSVGGNQVVNPAIEVVLISGNRANPNMTRYAYDACGGAGRSGSTNFSVPSGNGTFSILGQTFNHSFSMNNIVTGYIVRIIPLYANTRLAVNASPQLPSQGNIINSVGTSGNTTRKIRVFQGWPRVPIEYFPYNLFLP